MGEVHAGCFEDRFEVFQNLRGLFRDTARNNLPGGRIKRNLS
jgi:hypothetical protein